MILSPTASARRRQSAELDARETLIFESLREAGGRAAPLDVVDALTTELEQVYEERKRLMDWYYNPKIARVPHENKTSIAP